MRRWAVVILTLISSVLCLNCKKCKVGEHRQNNDVPANVKNALLQFPAGTSWIFMNSSNEKDTFTLGAVTYNYDDGVCTEYRDCCTKVFTQIAHQVMQPNNDGDGLEKFTAIKIASDHRLIEPETEYVISDNTNFTSKYKDTVVVNSQTLTDVQIVLLQQNPGVIPVKIFWSLSKGLVRYDYLQANSIYNIYERQNF